MDEAGDCGLGEALRLPKPGDAGYGDVKDILCGEMEPLTASGERMGEAGFSPAAGLTGAGMDVTGVLPFGFSSSCFLPSFQKSRFRGFADVSPALDSGISLSLRSTDGSFNRGEADSLDSVLGAALVLSLIDDAFGDIVS